MATVTSIASGTWIGQAATVWDTGAIPAPGDNVVLLMHTVTVDGTVTITNLAANNTAVLVFGAHIFNASGAIVLSNIEAIAAAATITTPDFFIGEVFGRGKLTLTDDLTLNGDFELAGGELDMQTSNDMTVNGDIVYSSGTLSNPGTITQGGTSDLAWLNATPSLTYAQAAGSTISLITASFTVVNSFTQPADAMLQSSEGRILLVRDTSAGWWNALGTVDVEVRVLGETSGPGSDIILTDKPLAFYSNSTHALTIDANIELGTGELSVYGAGAGNSMTLTMDGNVITCGPVVVGLSAPVTGNGILNLGSATHSISSIVGGHTDNEGNTLALDTCTINDMVAGIDGTLIDTVTVTNAHVYGNGDSIIMNVTPASGTLTCRDCVDGGGNNEHVVFVTSGIPIGLLTQAVID